MSGKDFVFMVKLLVGMGIVFVGLIWIVEGAMMAQSALLVYVFLMVPIFGVGIFATQDIDNRVEDSEK